MSKGTLFVVPAVLLVALTLTLVASPLGSSTPPEGEDERQCGTTVERLAPEEFSALVAKRLRPQLVPPGAPASPPYCIPIAIHVVRKDDGTGGISMSRLIQGLADINNHELYANTGMTFFYLPEIDYIDDTFYYEEMTTGSHFDDLRAENPVANAINVYFIGQGEIDGFSLCGLSSFTTSSTQGIVMINGCTGGSSNPSSYPHEVGHYFDLFHTHETAFGAELVDGSNCSTAGDLLCDTPADPGLSGKVDASCVYTGSATDSNGDTYVPDPRQLMSYSRKLCRTDVTPEGEARALNVLLNDRPELLRCPPVADCNGPYVAECTSTPAPGWTSVQLDGTGSSDPDGDAITYLWSGATFDDETSPTPTADFEVGTTPVRLIVSDGALLDTCDVDVTVVDTTPPSLTCPGNITVECVDYCGTPKDDPQLTAFFASFAATDACCDPDVTLENDAPDCFSSGCSGAGTTTVTFTATDCNGNSSQCTADVTVDDTTPPDIDVSVIPEYLWPPNHKMASISATVTVTDICDDAPQWVLESITSDEPDNGPGDGNTVGDIQADTGTTDVEFMLRSERSGKEDGRTYTIVYRAWDTCGNVAWDTAYVHVPHDQSAFAAGLAGYNATGTGIEPDAQTVVVAVLSREAEYELQGQQQILVTPALDATQIPLSTAYVGNTAGVALPIRSWKRDVSGDNLVDLMLCYSADDVRAIKTATEEAVTYEELVVGAIYDGPVGVHVVGGDGTTWLVDNIFALGEQIPFDWGRDERDWVREFEDEPLIMAQQGGDPVSYSNGIAAIFPNPFNPATTIRFTLADASDVTIAVYDVNGRLVRTLLDRALSAGQHTTAWDGTDTRGNRVATGVYFARMIAGDFAETRKMVLLK